jgi:hypothetical protein
MTATRLAWEVALEDIEDEQVVRCVRQWLQGGQQKWPSPAALLACGGEAGTSDADAWSTLMEGLRIGSIRLPADVFHARAFDRIGGAWRIKSLLTAEIGRVRGEFLGACLDVRALEGKREALRLIAEPDPPRAAIQFAALGRGGERR